MPYYAETMKTVSQKEEETNAQVLLKHQFGDKYRISNISTVMAQKILNKAF